MPFEHLRATLAPRLAPARATRAGLLAAAAYLAEMALDLALLDCPTNDLLLLGGFISRERRIWLPTGLALHFAGGVALAQLYGASAHRLPGSHWQRGLLFALAENTLLCGLLPLVDRYHPAIRGGQLPRLSRPVPVLQQTLRHGIYGVVLGRVYRASPTD